MRRIGGLTAMIKFVCKLCGEIINVREELSGRQIECPKCKRIRVVPPKSPKMRFHCKNCGQAIKVAQIHAGKKGKCPKCQKIINIPAHPEGTTITLVCSICNETIHVPEGTEEHFIECPKCNSFIEGLSKDE
jgi:DNA-directed RNA polymerase subunit RPC12/RpoP